MKDLRTRLALWIAPWLAKPTTVYFPTIYAESTSTAPLTSTGA